MWQSWIRSILVDVEGTRLLELGPGPGHLMVDLQISGRLVVGLDASWRMLHFGFLKYWLCGLNLLWVNGYAQFMPFHNSSFDQVVATFPANFIYSPATAQEIFRVLVPGGSFTTLPSAWLIGPAWYFRISDILHRITHHSPRVQPTDSAFSPPWLDDLTTLYTQAGFQVTAEIRTLSHSAILVVKMKKPHVPLHHIRKML